MKVEYCNVWDYPAEYHVVPINLTIKKNHCLVMGAGVARQAAEMYPHLPATFAKLLRLTDPTVKAPILVDKLYGIIGMPTKVRWQDTASLELIDIAAERIEQMRQDLQIDPDHTIALPAVGCGAGTLLWQDVSPVLAKHFHSDKYVVCLER